MAKITVRVSDGSECQASITWSRSGVIGAFAVSSSVECAAPSPKSSFSSGFRGGACGFKIRWFQVRVLAAPLSNPRRIPRLRRSRIRPRGDPMGRCYLKCHLRKRIQRVECRGWGGKTQVEAVRWFLPAPSTTAIQALLCASDQQRAGSPGSSCPPRCNSTEQGLMKHIRHLPLAAMLLLTILSAPSSVSAQARAKKESTAGQTTVSGLIISRDDNGLYVRTRDGQYEIEWNDHTQVALMVNTRQFKRLKGRTLSFAVHSSTQVLTYQLPKGPITGIVTTRGGRQNDQALEVARTENWIPERGLRLRFGEPPIPGQLPTAENPSFIGTWNPDTTPRTLTIGTTAYEISLKKGGQSKALLFGVITTRDCRPFVNRATILGIRKGDVIVANEIHVLPIGDQVRPRRPWPAALPLHWRLDFRQLHARTESRSERDVQSPSPADKLWALSIWQNQYRRMARRLQATASWLGCDQFQFRPLGCGAMTRRATSRTWKR